MEAASDFAQLELRFVDQIQWRYELIRPLVLFEDRPARQRAPETPPHPETVRKLRRRFPHQGLLGLLLDDVEVVPKEQLPRVSEAVVEEIARLKALSAGCHARELVRIVFYKLGERLDHKTAQRLWHQRAVTTQEALPLGDYHPQPDRYQARLQVIKLYAQGWEKSSLSRFLQVSRPTVDAWIKRFATEHCAGLLDKSSAPQAPARKVWLPLMLEVYHLQKRHPDAGEFRIWSLLGNSEISVRTVGRIMALNRQVYDDIPHRPTQDAPKDPRPHPYRATAPHEFWFIDGRKMDFAIEGVKWWSLIILDGYSRTMLAGAVAPTEASWVALMVLYTACPRYGAPTHLISDKGGAYISDDVEAVCTRLGIDHRTITSTQGESYKNLMETHFNIQRRLYDYQFSLTRTPLEFEQAHQDFLQLYTTTAHQGLLKEQWASPIPLDVLGAAQGRRYTPDELARKFAHALVPRTTNRYGCVTLHSYHFYVEQGLPQTQVLLWVYGHELRAVFDNVLLAAYHCHDDLRHGKVTDIRDGSFYPTRFASPQGSLIPLNPQESLVLYRPKSWSRQPSLPFPAQQLWLFERVKMA